MFFSQGLLAGQTRTALALPKKTRSMAAFRRLNSKRPGFRQSLGTPGMLGIRSQARFIPAGAGNTLCPCYLLPVQGVHPRGRGEHPGKINRRYLGNGSSPRARGTLQAVCLGFDRLRFIPAGAGNTPGGLSRFRPPPVIPAGAGNTGQRQRIRTARTVHPRRRGEHISPAVFK